MKLRYSHPSIPPQDINISDTYEVETLIILGLTKEMIDVLFSVVEEDKKDIKKTK